MIFFQIIKKFFFSPVTVTFEVAMQKNHIFSTLGKLKLVLVF